MRALALLALLCACGGGRGYYRPDVTYPGGLGVDLGPMEEGDLLPYLVACTMFLGDGTDGARVKVLPDATAVGRDCGEGRELAGCWRLDLDLALVAAKATWGETALCHELAHRALFRRTGDADLAHRSPLFGLADRVGRRRE